MEVIEDRIQQIIIENGIGYQGYDTDIEKTIEYLPNFIDMVNIASTWLKTKNKIKGTNLRSYAVKHMVEQWQNSTKGNYVYISTGAMIVAAILSGFTVKRDGHTQNAMIGISKKSLTKDDGYLRHRSWRKNAI